MAAFLALQSTYTDSDSSSDEESQEDISTKPSEDALLHLKPIEKKSVDLPNLQIAPVVEVKEEIGNDKMLDHIKNKEISFNPTYDQLYAPEQGPENPFKTKQQLAQKNALAGFVQNAHINNFQFENQRKTFHSYGFAIDPSVSNESSVERVITNREDIVDLEDKTVFEKVKKREGDKRKRIRQNDPDDIEGFLGPWGGFVDETKISKPTEEEQKELDELTSKRKKRQQQHEESAPHVEEKSTLHIKDAYDYQDRSFLHIPQDVGVNLKSDMPPRKCYLPKRLIHTWTGHTKAVSAIRLFPQSGHLVLSTSMDCKVKIWEVYNKRRLIRTYTGHSKAVRDACFNCEGEKFLTAAYDRYIKLWDTETGQCIRRFSNKKVPYCVKFNPSPSRQHFFVAGLSDKKICTWDTRSGDIVQEYDRHLGAVNTITFVDKNQRFVSTSDDKSLRVWEWDIPVDFKYIADPGMHSMPSATLSPNGKFLGCQSLDNKIMIFDVQTRFRHKRKKIFKGHMVAGYACQMGFSPDMSYVISGDGDGKLCVWDWKTTKLYTKFKAHDSVCIGCVWHPHETSKILTCGWDGTIKLWD